MSARILKSISIDKPYVLKIDFKTINQAISFCKNHKIRYTDKSIYDF